MDETAPLSAEMTQTIKQFSAYFQTGHPLFRQIPTADLVATKGQVSLDVTLPSSFADGDYVHPGLYVIVLDTFLALAAWTRLGSMTPLATINLKSDFFQTAKVGDVVTCYADCDDIVDEVAFCHGRVMSKGGQILARAAGTFMVGTISSKVKGSRL